MGAPYIYDISRLRVKDLHSATYIYVVRHLRVNTLTYINTHLTFASNNLCQFSKPIGITCFKNKNLPKRGLYTKGFHIMNQI